MLNPTTNTNSAPRRRIVVNTNINNNELTDAELKEYRDKVKEESQTELDKIKQAFDATNQTMKVNVIKPPPATQPQFKNTRVPVANVLAAKLEEAQEPEELPQSFQSKINSEVNDELGEHAVRSGIPSNGVFNDFDDISIRPFGVPEFAKIYKANSNKRDDMIIDVVNSTTNVNVWHLSEKDFRFLMYWQRINSYLRNPYKLNWTSFYGNVNSIVVNKTTLEIKQLDATRAEYKDWQARGFTMPTITDLQQYTFLQNSLSLEDKFIWLRAKYFVGSDVKDKIAKAYKTDPDTFFLDTNEFVAKFENYGVKETVQVTDSFFNSDKALFDLKTKLDQNISILENQTLVEELAEDLLEQTANIRAEIERINTEIANTGEAAPLRETVAFKINATDFFPKLQF